MTETEDTAAVVSENLSLRELEASLSTVGGGAMDITIYTKKTNVVLQRTTIFGFFRFFTEDGDRTGYY